MAMTLRLSEDETAALRAYADEHGISMQEAARDAVRRLTAGDQRDELIARILTEDSDLLHRLAQ